MKFKIKENLSKKQKKKTPEQFLVKNFLNEDAAREYAEKYCKDWKKITIEEVEP